MYSPICLSQTFVGDRLDLTNGRMLLGEIGSLLLRASRLPLFRDWQEFPTQRRFRSLLVYLMADKAE